MTHRYPAHFTYARVMPVAQARDVLVVWMVVGQLVGSSRSSKLAARNHHHPRHTYPLPHRRIKTKLRSLLMCRVPWCCRFMVYGGVLLRNGNYGVAKFKNCLSPKRKYLTSDYPAHSFLNHGYVLGVSRGAWATVARVGLLAARTNTVVVIVVVVRCWWWLRRFAAPEKAHHLSTHGHHLRC